MEDLERINEDKYWHYNSLVSLGSLFLAAWNGSIYRLEEVRQRQQDEALGGWSRVWSGRPDEQYRTSAGPSFSIPKSPPLVFWAAPFVWLNVDRIYDFKTCTKHMLSCPKQY